MMNWDLGIRNSDSGLFPRRSRCASSFRNPQSAIRNGVTLIELLITITIIATLAAMFLGASNAAMESARSARTKTTISKIHSLLMERLDSYKTRRVDLNSSVLNLINSITDQSAKGKALADARLMGTRELMKLEMPDRWSDLIGNSIGSPIRFAPDYPLWLEDRPSLSLAYLRRYSSLTGTPNEIEDNQGAECLYMIIMLATGDGEARTLFSRQDIGDTDGDGAPEILDGWGRPISYLRWPAGFTNESNLMTGAPESDPDTFDPFRRDKKELPPPFGPRARDLYPTELKKAIVSLDDDLFGYRLVPLVFSGGPDGDPDLFTAKDPLIDDPFREYLSSGVTARMGTPMSFNGSPSDSYDIDPEDDGDNWYDNLHNHLQDGR